MGKDYLYYWETFDGKHKGGPFKTIGALKSGLQTSRWGTYYFKEESRYRSYAEDGIYITRAELIKVSDEDWREEWKK